MKFLIIHNRYSRTGGEESVVATQQRILTEKGHEVQLYERTYDEIKKWRCWRAKSFFTSLRNKQAIKDVEEIIDSFAPDVAIIHNLYPVISPAILPTLKKRGIKVLMTLHNYRLVCPTGLFFTHGQICERCGESSLKEMNCLFRRCEGSIIGSAAYAFRNWRARKKMYYSANVDCFMALSGFQRDKLSGYGLPYDKFTVIPNCIDPASMPDPDAPEQGFVGYVGRLSEEKGVGLLFETARAMPEVKFKVAGETATSLDIKNIPHNIEFVGFLDRKQLADFYTSAQMIILTSICYEGFPLSVIEGMYYRRAVIVPDIGALREITAGGECGMIYTLNDKNSLSEAINTLAGDKYLRDELGRKGRERVTDLYNPSQYYDMIMEAAEKK